MNNTAISNKTDEKSESWLVKNISNLLETNQMNENELAKNLGIPYNTIHRIMEGITVDPRMSTLKQIADHFGVTLDYLMKKQGSTKIETNDQISVPILNWGDFSEENFLENIQKETFKNWISVVQIENYDTDDLFALESTRSMQPRFPSGTTFILKYKEPPIDGDLILVKFKDSNSVSLRELVIDPPEWKLNAVVPSSSDLIFNYKEYEILGVVILTLIKSRKN